VRYDPRKCPTTGEEPYESGVFEECGEGFGVRDMVGNVWEWTDDKEGDYPLMAGGSYKMNENAHCGVVSEGTVATEAADVGFRCCK
jgi:formylglycine-generating enzyme required for sulfatase activity